MTQAQIASNRKATVKFKRTKTLARKSLQLAELSNVMINILIYDPRRRRLTECYTNEDVSFESMVTKTRAKKTKKERIKFKSKNIREMAGTTHEESMEEDELIAMSDPTSPP